MVDLFEDMLATQGMSGAFTRRTLKAYNRGKTPQKSKGIAIEKAFEGYTGGGNLNELQEEIKHKEDHKLLNDPYAGPWLQILSSYEIRCSEPVFWTSEARRFLDCALELREIAQGKSKRSPSDVLDNAHLANTRTYRETLRRLREYEARGNCSEDQLLTPLFLETALYLMACHDFECRDDNYVTSIEKGVPAAKQSPMTKFIKKVRAWKKPKISSYAKAAQLLLPDQSPDSAISELKKWRKGRRYPPWKNVKKWPSEFPDLDPWDLYWAIGYARIIQEIFKKAVTLEKALDWFRADWIVEDRDTIGFHVPDRYQSFLSSQSSGRRSSPRD
ncbi:MAG: hypothetical protein JJ855_19710 [Rhodospirillales bacterium]|nr:hypothetical protein [Rhodospirillales bacterium]